MKWLPLTLCACLASSYAFAYKTKTAADILNSDMTPQEKGRAIMVEGDDRDLGFGNFTVDLEMILRNTHGDVTTRKQRNLTFERQDRSVGDKTMIVFDSPRDVKGTAFLTYSNILEADDQWLYLPSLKRVKRISSKNKSGPFVGSEFAYEDISSIEVDKYKDTYLKQEPCPDASLGLDCFVVERIPQYEYSGYTKQITWVDVEEFRAINVDYYDRKDELLKTLEFREYKQYLDRYWRADKFLMKNHQTGKSTDLLWKNYKFQAGLKESDFTKANLKRMK